MNFEKAKNTFLGVQEADIFAKRKLDRTFEWCCAGNHHHHHDRYENMNPPSVATVNSRVAGLIQPLFSFNVYSSVIVFMVFKL